MFRKSFVLVIFGMAVLLMMTAVAFPQKIVIKQWDQFSYAGETAAGPAIDKLQAKYEKLNPNIKIMRSEFSPVKIRELTRLAFGAGTEADLIYTWPAYAVLADYAKIGLLYNMTEDAKKLGWFNVLPKLMIEACSYKGGLYAYPSEQDYNLVYYNKRIFEQLGLTEPHTYTEFLEVCDRAKEAGYYPIAFGNRKRWPATGLFSYIVTLFAGKDKIDEVIRGDAKWNRKEFVGAAEIMMNWKEKGYFPPGINGLGYNEANELFTMGLAAMNITGTWVILDMVKGLGPNLGVFQLPSIKEGVPQATFQGPGSQWIISARSSPKVQKEAVKYLDFLYSEENIKVWVEEGYLIPVRKGGLDWTKYEFPEVVEKAFKLGDATQDINGYDLHCVVPEGVCEELYAAFQSMVGEEISPFECLSKIQRKWEEAKATGKIWMP